MAQRRNTLILLSSAILFLLLFLFAFYFVKPVFDRSTELSGEIQQEQRLTEILRKKLAEKQTTAEIRSVDDVQGALPYWDNTEQLALDLERIGAEVKVSHGSLSFGGDLAASQPLLDRGGSAQDGIGSSGGSASSTDASAGAGSVSGEDPLSQTTGGGAEITSDAGQAQDQAATTVTGPKKLQVAAVIKGSYEAILAYVDEVNKLERITTVDSLEIARGGSSSEDGRELTVNFSFTAYFDPSYLSEVENPLLPYAESSAPSPKG